jgi:hypothetical protein
MSRLGELRQQIKDNADPIRLPIPEFDPELTWKERYKVKQRLRASMVQAAFYAGIKIRLETTKTEILGHVLARPDTTP